MPSPSSDVHAASLAKRSSASPPTDRVVAVLELLAANPEGVSASSAARALRLNGSTCAVLLGSLARARWVERAADKTYRLGAGLLPLVDAMRARYPLLGPGEEVLRQLSDALGCACVLTRIDASHILVVAASRGEELGGTGPGRDRRFPIDPPYGSVAVAWRSAEEIERWLDLPATPLTRSERAHYRRLLADVRECGYAVWRLDERDPLLPGRVRVIAPIFGPDRQPHYEIIAELVRPAMRGSEIESVAKRVLESAELLTRAIGGTRAGRSASFR
jgi:DNA-binding IclR family transcriptional regulator